MNELDNKPPKNSFEKLNLEDIDKFIKKIRRHNQETKKFITKVEQEIDNHHE